MAKQSEHIGQQLDPPTYDCGYFACYVLSLVEHPKVNGDLKLLSSQMSREAVYTARNDYWNGLEPGPDPIDGPCMEPTMSLPAEDASAYLKTLGIEGFDKVPIKYLTSQKKLDRIKSLLEAPNTPGVILASKTHWLALLKWVEKRHYNEHKKRHFEAGIVYYDSGSGGMGGTFTTSTSAEPTFLEDFGALFLIAPVAKPTAGSPPTKADHPPTPYHRKFWGTEPSTEEER
jgi:hypothetical protein